MTRMCYQRKAAWSVDHNEGPASLFLQARTQEAQPVGSVGLSAEVVGPRTVRARWTAPVEPNGQIYFNVYFEGLFYADPGAQRFVSQ